MTKETRVGGESSGGEVNFDAILAQVVEETGAEAQGKVVKAENKKKSKTRVAEISGELGERMKNLTKVNNDGNQEELIATAFNFLVYSEFHNKKIPEVLQKKLDVYNQAKNKYSESVKKMENLPDNLKDDPRLKDALDNLKSKMVAEARELASELGVSYEEIAKGETALLGTEDVEIARLRDEADKLSPGKIEYAKESYEEYSQRVVAGKRDRMTKFFSDKLNERVDEFGREQDSTIKDPKVLEDNRKKEKAYETMAEIELEKLANFINNNVADQNERKEIFAFLDRKFGGVIYQANKEQAILCVYESDTIDQKLASQLTLSFARAESRLELVREILTNNNLESSDNKKVEFVQFLSRVDDNMDLLNKQIYEPYRFGGSTKFITAYYRQDVDKVTMPSFIDMHVVLLNNLSDGSGGLNNRFRGDSFIRHNLGILTKEHPNEIKAFSDEFEKKFKKKLIGREPTDQDKVDLLVNRDNQVEVKNLDDAKALIAVLQEQVRDALSVAADKGQESRDLSYNEGKRQREINDLQLEIKQLQKRLDGMEEMSRQSDRESKQQVKTAEERANQLSREKQELENKLRALEPTIKKITDLVKNGLEEGLPAFGKDKERARRQEILDALSELTK